METAQLLLKNEKPKNRVTYEKIREIDFLFCIFEIFVPIVANSFFVKLTNFIIKCVTNSREMKLISA